MTWVVFFEKDFTNRNLLFLASLIYLDLFKVIVYFLTVVNHH